LHKSIETFDINLTIWYFILWRLEC